MSRLRYLVKRACRASLAPGTSVLALAAAEAPPGLALVPAGSFAMDDHHGFVDPKHGGDETPVRTVCIDAFVIDLYPGSFAATYPAFKHTGQFMRRKVQSPHSQP